MLQDQSDEDETLSQCSSEPAQSVIQSPNSCVHVANRNDTKEDTHQPEHMSGNRSENSEDFTLMTEQTPDEPEDLSLSHTKDRTLASATANMEGTMGEGTIEGHTDEDVREHETPVTREPTIDGNKDKHREDERCDQRLEDEEEDDWKETHIESEERKQNTDTSRYVALLTLNIDFYQKQKWREHSTEGLVLAIQLFWFSMPVQLTSKLLFSIATKGNRNLYFSA